MEPNYQSNYYYPKSPIVILSKQDFLVNRMKNYYMIKKRIEKVYSHKAINRFKVESFQICDNCVETFGKTMPIKRKTNTKQKTVGTSVDKLDLTVSLLGLPPSSHNARSPMTGWVSMEN
jgi:hypothetical protein